MPNTNTVAVAVAVAAVATRSSTMLLFFFHFHTGNMYPYRRRGRSSSFDEAFMTAGCYSTVRVVDTPATTTSSSSYSFPVARTNRG